MSSSSKAERRAWLSRLPPHWWLFTIAVLGLLVVSLWLRARMPASPPPVIVAVRRKSISVLPFVNTNPDSSDNYLGLGVASELTRVMRPLSGLRVADQFSALNEQHRDPVSWGQRLQVE